MNSILGAVRIVLVEPAGALNVGSVARVMKNMGLRRLVLVNPHCDPFSEESKRMAVHGIDVLNELQQVATIEEALQGCHRAIATTARNRHLTIGVETPREALPWLLDACLESALIFGPEDRGLSNQELNYAQRWVSIPANPEYSSLNLAQAVAVCTYELAQSTLKQPSEKVFSRELASLDALEAYYQHLERLLLHIGYLHPQTTAAKMEKFRHIYNRTNLSVEELALLRGILRQTEWAVQHLVTSRSQSLHD